MSPGPRHAPQALSSLELRVSPSASWMWLPARAEGGLPVTPCPSAQLYAAPRSLSEKKRPFFFLSTHPRPLVLSSNLLCRPTPASPAAANEMPAVAHKGRAVAVSALPAKASPHIGLAFPQGSSGQLPLRFTARTLGENEAPTNSSPIPGMPPPQNHPWAGSFVFC